MKFGGEDNLLYTVVSGKDKLELMTSVASMVASWRFLRSWGEICSSGHAYDRWIAPSPRQVQNWGGHVCAPDLLWLFSDLLFSALVKVLRWIWIVLRSRPCSLSEHLSSWMLRDILLPINSNLIFVTLWNGLSSIRFYTDNKFVKKRPNYSLKISFFNLLYRYRHTTYINLFYNKVHLIYIF